MTTEMGKLSESTTAITTEKPFCTCDEPDWGDWYSICDPKGEGCVYIGVGGDDAGFWLWLSVDCNTTNFTESLLKGVSEPEGPFEHLADAVNAGIDAAMEWMRKNYYGNLEEIEKDLYKQISAIQDLAKIDEAILSVEMAKPSADDYTYFEGKK
jgi:hypothetical protein